MNLLKEGIDLDIVKNTERTTKIPIDGKLEELKVYKIKISNLYFNDKNDRIATFISQYKDEEKNDNLDFKNREEYNNILHKFIVDSNKKAFEATKKNIRIIGQHKDIVVLKDGRIIDGNRRFTCLRDLYNETKDPKFLWIDAVILDKENEADERQIKILELMLQQGEDKKVDYDPIEKLVGIYKDIIKNQILTEKDYAKSIGMKDSEFKKEVEVSKLLIEFLDYFGFPEKYYLAREFKLDGPIREVHKVLRKTNDYYSDNKKIQLFKILSSTIIGDGDKTRFIRDLGRILLDDNLENMFEENDDNFKYIYETLRKNNDIKENISLLRNSDQLRKIQNSLSNSINKVNSELSKNEPLELTNRAQNNLNAIHSEIFMKLSKEQLKKIKQELEIIEKKCAELKEKIDA